MEAESTAQVVNAAIQNPQVLAAVAGFLFSHVVQPLGARIPVALKPLAILGSSILGTAAVAMTQGVPVKMALTYGAITAASAATTHATLFRENGLLAILAKLAGVVKQVPPVTPATRPQIPGVPQR